jgi:predicted RNase H-like HicB family nuclease
VGYIEEISGVNTQGRTLKEVQENLKEALTLIVEANRELTRNSIERYKDLDVSSMK